MADEPMLVTVYFTGHGETRNDVTYAINEYGNEGNGVEEFLRQVAELSPLVHTLGILDCCRRGRGQAGISTALFPNMRNIMVYREPIVAYEKGSCDCEPWKDEKDRMPYRLFDALLSQQDASIDKVTLIPDAFRALPEFHTIVNGYDNDKPENALPESLF